MSKSHNVYFWYTLHKMAIETCKTKENAILWYNYIHDFWWNLCYKDLKLSHKMYVWVCKRLLDTIDKKGE